MKTSLLSKRVFHRAQDSERVEVSFETTQKAKKALNELAEVLGRTEEELFIEAIERVLQEYVRNGSLKLPEAG